jgi:hypothetical protein
VELLEEAIRAGKTGSEEDDSDLSDELASEQDIAELAEQASDGSAELQDAALEAQVQGAADEDDSARRGGGDDSAQRGDGDDGEDSSDVEAAEGSSDLASGEVAAEGISCGDEGGADSSDDSDADEDGDRDDGDTGHDGDSDGEGDSDAGPAEECADHELTTQQAAGIHLFFTLSHPHHSMRVLAMHLSMLCSGCCWWRFTFHNLTCASCRPGASGSAHRAGTAAQKIAPQEGSLRCLKQQVAAAKEAQLGRQQARDTECEPGGEAPLEHTRILTQQDFEWIRKLKVRAATQPCCAGLIGISEPLSISTSTFVSRWQGCLRH